VIRPCSSPPWSLMVGACPTVIAGQPKSRGRRRVRQGLTRNVEAKGELGGDPCSSTPSGSSASIGTRRGEGTRPRACKDAGRGSGSEEAGGGISTRMMSSTKGNVRRPRRHKASCRRMRAREKMAIGSAMTNLSYAPEACSPWSSASCFRNNKDL